MTVKNRLFLRGFVAVTTLMITSLSAVAQNSYQYLTKYNFNEAYSQARVTTDPDNNIYVTGYNEVAVLYPYGGLYRTLGFASAPSGLFVTGTAAKPNEFRAYAATNNGINVYSPHTNYNPIDRVMQGTFSDVAMDSDSSLVIVETNKRQIQRIVNNTYVQTFGGIGDGANQFGVTPISGMDVDSAGNIYCSDPDKNRIAVFDRWGNFIRSITDIAIPSKFGDLDVSGDRVYVVNSTRSTVDVYATTGMYVTSMGQSGKPGEPTLATPKSVAVDSAGRVVVLGSGGIYVYVPRDTTPPTTAIGMYPNINLENVLHWVNQPATVGISANDGFAGSGVSEIRYKLNNGSVVVPGDNAVIFVDKDGVYQIDFFATDNSQNSASTKTVLLGIDSTAPTTSYVFSSDRLRITLSANDALSGAFGTIFRLDDRNWMPYDEVISLDGGNHVLRYTSVDFAGNREAERTLNISGSRVTALYAEPVSTVSEGQAKFRVMLDKPAPGGAKVRLYCPDLRIDDFIYVESGKSEGVLVCDKVISVDDSTVFKVWASLGNDSSVQCTLTIVPRIMTFSIAPRESMPGSKGTGKVTIKYKSGNAPLQVFTSNPNVVVPSSVNWNDKTSVAFQYKVLPNAPAGKATITVKYKEQTASEEITIGSYELLDAYTDPSEIGYNGVSAVYAVINAPAPPGGLVLNLSTSNKLLKVPATLTVPGGETVGAATIQAGYIVSLEYIDVNYKNDTLRASIRIRSPLVSDIFFTPDSVVGGMVSKGVLTVDGVPNNALAFPVVSSNPLVAKSMWVTMSKGKTSAPISLTTYPVGKPTPVTISVSEQNETKTTDLLVMPVNVSIVKITTPTIRSSGMTVVTVSLAKTAGVETTVNLSTSTAGVVLIPTSLTIPKGKSSVTFTATALATSARKTTAIQAETDGKIKSATITVNP
jgi:hypothetical protein